MEKKRMKRTECVLKLQLKKKQKNRKVNSSYDPKEEVKRQGKKCEGERQSARIE